MLALLLLCAVARAGLQDDLVGSWHYEDRSGDWYTLVLSANGGFELYSEGLGATGHYKVADDGTTRFTYDGYSQLNQWPVGTVTVVSAVVQGDTLTLTARGQQPGTWQRVRKRTPQGPADFACLGVLLLLCAGVVFRLVMYVRDKWLRRRSRDSQPPSSRDVVGAFAAAVEKAAAALLFVGLWVVIAGLPVSAWMAWKDRLYSDRFESHVMTWWDMLVFVALFIGAPFLVRPIWSWIREWLDLEDRIDSLFRR